MDGVVGGSVTSTRTAVTAPPWLPPSVAISSTLPLRTPVIVNVVLPPASMVTKLGAVIAPFPLVFSGAPSAAASAGDIDAVIVAVPPTGTDTVAGESTMTAPSYTFTAVVNVPPPYDAGRIE